MRYRLWRIAVFVVALCVPLFWLYSAGVGGLGPDPGKTLLVRLGLGALDLLLISLAMMPLQRLTRWGGWMAVRRQVGLWCFAYAALHIAAYVVFVLGFSLAQLAEDVFERPYIIVGALAFVGLLLLAVTSNRYSIRKLGRRWKMLHRLSYLILVLALLHMLWVVRADWGQWLVYAVIGFVLLFIRLPVVQSRLRARRRGKEQRLNEMR